MCAPCLQDPFLLSGFVAQFMKIQCYPTLESQVLHNWLTCDNNKILWVSIMIKNKNRWSPAGDSQGTVWGTSFWDETKELWFIPYDLIFIDNISNRNTFKYQKSLIVDIWRFPESRCPMQATNTKPQINKREIGKVKKDKSSNWMIFIRTMQQTLHHSGLFIHWKMCCTMFIV